MEVLVVLAQSVSPAEREDIARVAPARQMASDRVFVASVAEEGVEAIRGMRGVAQVMIGSEASNTLPPLSTAESLFAQAWLLAKHSPKTRSGEGLDWDTPPRQPPDPRR